MSKKRVLILRFSALGDIVILIYLLKSLKIQSSSKYHFTIATHPKVKPFLKELPEVDFIEVDFKDKFKGIKGLLDLFHVFYGMKFDVILDFHDVIRTKVLKALFRMVSIPVFTFYKGRKEKNEVIQNKLNDKRNIPTTFERYYNLFKTLDNGFEINENQYFEKIELNENCISFLGELDSIWIGIAPFSKHKSKEYPLEKIKEIVDFYSNNKKVNFLIFGFGEIEKTKIDAMFLDYYQVKNTISKFTFEEECAMISNLDIMISMDSANGHIASLYNIPTITIWELHIQLLVLNHIINLLKIK